MPIVAASEVVVDDLVSHYKTWYGRQKWRVVTEIVEGPGWIVIHSMTRGEKYQRAYLPTDQVLVRYRVQGSVAGMREIMNDPTETIARNEMRQYAATLFNQAIDRRHNNV